MVGAFVGCNGGLVGRRTIVRGQRARSLDGGGDAEKPRAAPLASYANERTFNQPMILRLELIGRELQDLRRLRTSVPIPTGVELDGSVSHGIGDERGELTPTSGDSLRIIVTLRPESTTTVRVGAKRVDKLTRQNLPNANLKRLQVRHIEAGGRLPKRDEVERNVRSEIYAETHVGSRLTPELCCNGVK